MIFLKYLTIQVFAYAIDMGSFLGLISFLGLKPISANVISKVLAGSFAYWTHVRFTFASATVASDESGRKSQASPWRYILLLVLNIPFNSLLLASLLPIIVLPAGAKLLSDSICILINFWVSKRFVFASRRPT
jgi:putative flippase GtrA